MDDWVIWGFLAEQALEILVEPPFNRTQPQRPTFWCYAFSPSQETFCRPAGPLPGTHSHLKLTRVCSALPSKLGAWEFQDAVSSPLSMLDMACSPHSHQDMALRNSLQSFSPLAVSGKCSADPPYAQSIINFKGKAITDFLPLGPGIAGGDKRRAEGDWYEVSSPTLYLVSCCLSMPSSLLYRLNKKVLL